MPSIARRWNRQPTQFLDINNSHWLASSCEAFFNSGVPFESAINAVNGWRSPAHVAGAIGPSGASRTTTQTLGSAVGLQLPRAQAANRMTVVCRVARTPAVATMPIGTSRGFTVSAGALQVQWWSDNNIYFDLSNSGVRLSPTQTESGDNTLASTWDGTTKKLFLNGVELASGIDADALFGNPQYAFLSGISGYYWAAFARCLVLDEIIQFGREPYAILADRRQRRIYFVDAPAATFTPPLDWPQTDLPRDQRGGADAFDNGLGGELLTLDYFGFAAPSGAISATSTSTLEAIAGAVTGTVASAGINATTSVTLDAVAGSAAAAVRVAATTAATLGAVVGSATATVLATATSSATLATVTGAVTAVVGNTISATTSATLEGLAGSATAAVRVAASTTGTLATITGSATGALRIAAGTTATLDTVAGSVTGVVANQVSATTTAVLAGVAGAVTATARIEATSAATLQALEGNAAAAVLGLATSTATLAGVTGSASIFGGVIRVLSSAATLAEVVGAASAVTIEIGDQAPSRARIGRKTLAQSARIGSEVLRGKNTTTRH